MDNCQPHLQTISNVLRAKTGRSTRRQAEVREQDKFDSPPGARQEASIREWLALMKENIPFLKQVIHLASPTHITLDDMQKHLDNIHSTATRMEALLDQDQSCRTLLLETTKMFLSTEYLSVRYFRDDINGDIHAINNTLKTSYLKIQLVLEGRAREGDISPSQTAGPPGQRYLDTSYNREDLETVPRISEGFGHRIATENATKYLRTCTERLQSGYPLPWYITLRAFREAHNVFERLETLPAGDEKTVLQRQYLQQEHSFLNAVLLHKTAHPDAGRLLADIALAPDQHKRPAMLDAIKVLAPDAYQTYLNHPELHDLRLSREDAKPLKPWAGTFYVLLRDDIPYHDDPVRSVAKFVGALYDVRREDNYGDNKNHPDARLEKLEDIKELYLKMGVHRPP
ncbi:MAG: hypothetical protein J2P36_15195, partial [Ktedonobacteraceae bacterium]|nr:hypothetical protein [Ktedonobacteraceae bacterium]